MELRRLTVLVLVLLIPLCGGIGEAVAQPGEKVKIEAAFRPAEASPGDTVKLEVKARVRTGYHIYAIAQPEDAIPLPTSFEWGELGGLEAKPFEETPPIPHEDEFVGKYNYHEGVVTFTSRIVVPESASGKIDVSGTMTSMACTWQACDPPSTQRFAAALQVKGGAPAPGKKGPGLAGAGFNVLGSKPKSRVTWKSSFEPTKAAPGSTVKLVITGKMQDGYHIYGLEQPEGAIPLPTVIKVTETAGLSPSLPFRESEPVVHEDEILGKYTYHEEEFSFWTPVTIPEDAPAGERTLKGTVASTACTEKICDELKTEGFAATIQVDPTAEVVQVEVAPAPVAEKGAGGGEKKGEDEERGLLVLILIAVAGGFGVLATPCVFPMIPITVSFFTKQAEDTGGKVFWLAFAYAMGIVVSFTGFGVLLAAIKGASGAQMFAANPWVNLSIAAIFVVFALSLFGLFDIRLPTGLLNRLDGVSRRGSGFIAVMFMGFTFTLAAFTCTVPFMGLVFTEAAAGQWFRPIVGMLFFSGTFALPFFFLALFPKYLAAMPRSGGWMNAVKVTMGFIELAAAFKFLSSADLIWQWGLISRPLMLAAWVGIFGFTGLYLLGFFRMAKDAAIEGVGTLRMLFALLFVTFTLYLSTGLGGSSLGVWLDGFLPPPGYPGGYVQASSGNGTVEDDPNDPTPRSGKVIHAGLRWLEDLDEALAVAKAERKKIFINFTGFA